MLHLQDLYRLAEWKTATAIRQGLAHCNFVGPVWITKSPGLYLGSQRWKVLPISSVEYKFVSCAVRKFDSSQKTASLYTRYNKAWIVNQKDDIWFSSVRNTRKFRLHLSTKSRKEQVLPTKTAKKWESFTSKDDKLLFLFRIEQKRLQVTPNNEEGDHWPTLIQDKITFTGRIAKAVCQNCQTLKEQKKLRYVNKTVNNRLTSIKKKGNVKDSWRVKEIEKKF